MVLKQLRRKELFPIGIYFRYFQAKLQSKLYTHQLFLQITYLDSKWNIGNNKRRC